MTQTVMQDGSEPYVTNYVQTSGADDYPGQYLNILEGFYRYVNASGTPYGSQLRTHSRPDTTIFGLPSKYNVALSAYGITVGKSFYVYGPELEPVYPDGNEADPGFGAQWVGQNPYWNAAPSNAVLHILSGAADARVYLKM